MILSLPDGSPIRGDMVKSAVVRSDLSPIPLTLEADIRSDDTVIPYLSEGKAIVAGGDEFSIVKTTRVAESATRGGKELGATRLVGLLSACHQVAYTRERAIVKERAMLSGIYRAAGAKVKQVESDFVVERFYCLAGDTPTYHITRALQEEGGVLVWRSGVLKFMRLPDLERQKSKMTVPDGGTDDTESGFLERHEVPWFYSLAPDGGFLFGNRQKTRAARFSPLTTRERLFNLSRYLVRRKVVKADYSPTIRAGDLVTGEDGGALIVMTAAHVFEVNTDGGGANQYSKLWLGTVEN